MKNLRLPSLLTSFIKFPPLIEHRVKLLAHAEKPQICLPKPGHNETIITQSGHHFHALTFCPAPCFMFLCFIFSFELSAFSFELSVLSLATLCSTWPSKPRCPGRSRLPYALGSYQKNIFTLVLKRLESIFSISLLLRMSWYVTSIYDLFVKLYLMVGWKILSTR